MRVFHIRISETGGALLLQASKQSPATILDTQKTLRIPKQKATSWHHGGHFLQKMQNTRLNVHLLEGVRVCTESSLL